MYSEKLKEYQEDDFLMLSGIQHFIFCRRQWALIHIEQQWAENFYTVDGEFFHEKAHDAEKRAAGWKHPVALYENFFKTIRY